jgi:hypothetical protein
VNGNSVDIRLTAGTFNWRWLGTISGTVMSGNFTVFNTADGAAGGGTFGVTKASLLASAPGPDPTPAGTPAPSILPADVAVSSLVESAIAAWEAHGIGDDRLAALRAVDVRFIDLPGNELGAAGSDVIYLDRDAAGFGWFVDPTPRQNDEFTSTADGTSLIAVDGPAAGRIDLLSVLLHEMGHTLGLDHTDSQHESVGPMAPILGQGLRRLPAAVPRMPLAEYTLETTPPPDPGTDVDRNLLFADFYGRLADVLSAV